MFSRTRVLLVAIVVALFAWMLGYGMGGGFRDGGKGATDSSDEAAAHGSGTAGRKAGLHDGTVRTADDTLADQIAARRIPWTRERLVHSISALTHQPDDLHWIRFAMTFIEQLGPDDFPLALEVARNTDAAEMEMHRYMSLIYMRWAELNPNAVTEYLDAKGAKDITAYWLRRDLLRVWGASDPAAAIAWAKTLPEPKDQQEALKGILETAARRNVDAAIALARVHAPEVLSNQDFGSAINNLLGNRDPERNARTIAALGNTYWLPYAASQWAQKDFDAAMNWAQELPDQKLRSEALNGVWKGYAVKHPEEAAALFPKVAEREPSIMGAASQIVSMLAAKDPKEAIRWAFTLQPSTERGMAFNAIGERYANEDVAAADRWLNSLPAGGDRDNAASGLVGKTRSDHPREATEWAATIQSDVFRRSILRDTLSTWFAKDLPSALEWLQTSPSISEEDRQAILKKK